MALKPSYNDKLHLPGLSKTEILILALEASQKLEWNIEEVTPEGARFEVPFNMYSHGEEITFTIEPGSDGEVAVRSQSSSVQFVDYGKNRKNIQKLRETMEEIKTSLTPEELTQKAKDFEEECNRPLTEEEKAYLEEEKKRNSFWSFFIPRKGFMATPILIDLNILVFIVMIASGVEIMSPSTLSLLKWGADFGPLTLTGDWWRAVTCNFIHIGAFHLLMNMYAFMYVGLLLEDLIGSRRMFMSYLLTGLCSAVFSLYMHGETISAGASGAIFGLYGIFLAFLFFHRIAKEQRKALLTSILIFVGYNLVYGMKAGIDNAAHIGGLLSGFLLGIIYVCSYKFEKADAQRTVSILGELGIFCIFLFSFIMLCKNVPPLYQNMYAFMYVGLLLEDLIGSRRMFMSYLLTGLCSAVFSLYMHGETISAGASGAIFGLYGIFLAFLFFHRIAKEQRKALLTSILIFVGYNLVYGMKAGIDNAAHIGGLLSGFLLGIIYVCSYKFEKADAQRTVSILGELGIFCIFLFSFIMLCKNVPPLYQDIRGEWESGIVEAYLNGELEEENEDGNQSDMETANSSSTRQYPSYIPVGNNDTWLSYYDAETNFSCQYPTNWTKITGAKGLTPSAEPPLLRLANGANQLTVTALTYDTQKEFEHIKKLSLTLPRNAQGEPSEDYKQSNVNINGLSMTRTTNPLHIGAPDEPGEDIQQIVLHYFQESKKRTFTIVMLVYDEEAETDLNAITSSIQITQ